MTETMTKEAALEHLLEGGLRYLADQKDVPQRLEMVRKVRSYSIPQLAGILERFLVPAEEKGLLRSYIELELGRAQAMAFAAGQQDVSSYKIPEKHLDRLEQTAKKAIAILRM